MKCSFQLLFRIMPLGKSVSAIHFFYSIASFLQHFCRNKELFSFWLLISLPPFEHYIYHSSSEQWMLTSLVTALSTWQVIFGVSWGSVRSSGSFTASPYKMEHISWQTSVIFMHFQSFSVPLWVQGLMPCCYTPSFSLPGVTVRLCGFLPRAAGEWEWRWTCGLWHGVGIFLWVRLNFTSPATAMTCTRWPGRSHRGNPYNDLCWLWPNPSSVSVLPDPCGRRAGGSFIPLRAAAAGQGCAKPCHGSGDAPAEEDEEDEEGRRCLTHR